MPSYRHALNLVGVSAVHLRILQASSADASVRGVREAAKRPGKVSELKQLMYATTSSVHAQYSSHHQALSAIIDHQTGITEVLEKQKLSAATAQMLTVTRAAAMQKIQKGYVDVLHALQRATVQETVTEEALLDVWSAARRRLLAEHKNAAMASTPCTTAPNGAVLQAENLHFKIGQNSISENMQQVRTTMITCYMYCQDVYE